MLLTVRNLSRNFGGLAALRDFDVDVREGEILGLIGPNGAGKTTLFNVISGIYKPTNGRVVFKGEDITGLKPNAIARKGMVRTFQLTNVFKGMTVLDNVMLGHHVKAEPSFLEAMFGNRTYRDKENRRLAKARQVLGLVGLEGLSNEIADHLPHGHARALGVAIACAAEPALLLLDEPIAGMNPTESVAMANIIRRIRDTGVTIILVEHHMSVVMGISDRVVVLNQGEKIAEGSPQEVTKNKDVIEAYLGTGSYAT